MAPIEDWTRRLLRSLCVGHEAEIEHALDNFNRTEVGDLPLTGVQEMLRDEICDFYRRKSGPPFLAMLQEEAAAKGRRELELYLREVLLAKLEIGSSYVTILENFLEEAGKLRLRSLLLETGQVLDEGINDPAEKGAVLQGFLPASRHVISGAVALQQQLGHKRQLISSLDAPDVLRALYLDAKMTPQSTIGGTSLTPLDEHTFGAKPGDLWVIGGHTGDGKTTFCFNWARYLVIDGGWNAYYLTLEMRPIELWPMVAASYSNHPRWDRPALDARDILAGRLNTRDQSFYMELLKDLRNPDYGTLVIESPTEGASVTDLWARAEALHAQHRLDIVFVDYLSLLDQERKSRARGRYEAVNESIKMLKRMALNFASGEGIPIVTPHQLNRKGWNDAKARGGIYQMDAFAETSEIENSADELLTLYCDDELAAIEEVKICHLKNRRGRRADPFNAYMNQANRYIGNLRVPELDTLLH